MPFFGGKGRRGVGGITVVDEGAPATLTRNVGPRLIGGKGITNFQWDGLSIILGGRRAEVNRREELKGKRSPSLDKKEAALIKLSFYLTFSG